jgi:hypothetical protein
MTFKRFHSKQTLDPRLLNFRDRLTLATQRRGCAPVNSMLELIKRAEDELADQSKVLAPLVLTCQQSALYMADIYLLQR